MTANYDTEKRSRAAKAGWAVRRYVPTPEERADRALRRRFFTAMRAADPQRARLYVADVAQAVQHYYLAAFPGDTRTLDALAMARTMASAAPPTAYQVRTMRKRLIERFGTCEASAETKTPAYYALQSAGFATSASIAWCIEWGLTWSDAADDPACYWHPDFERHTPALEALAR